MRYFIFYSNIFWHKIWNIYNTCMRVWLYAVNLQLNEFLYCDCLIVLVCNSWEVYKFNIHYFVEHFLYSYHLTMRFFNFILMSNETACTNAIIPSGLCANNFPAAPLIPPSSSSKLNIVNPFRCRNSLNLEIQWDEV